MWSVKHGISQWSELLELIWLGRIKGRMKDTYCTFRCIKQFSREIGQERIHWRCMNFPRGEADQTLPEDSWWGGVVSSRKQSGGQAEREGWQVTWIKVRTCMSKAKGHKQGPKPETQPIFRQIFWAGLAEKGVRSKLGGSRLLPRMRPKFADLWVHAWGVLIQCTNFVHHP